MKLRALWNLVKLCGRGGFGPVLRILARGVKVGTPDADISITAFDKVRGPTHFGFGILNFGFGISDFGLVCVLDSGIWISNLFRISRFEIRISSWGGQDGEPTHHNRPAD
jgi:hypothetical protein